MVDKDILRHIVHLQRQELALFQRGIEREEVSHIKIVSFIQSLRF